MPHALDTSPLTPIQQGLAVESLRDPSAYVQQLICEISEAVDESSLRSAWAITCANHPILSAAILWASEGPLLELRPGTEILFVRRSEPPAERDQRLRAFLREDRAFGIDLRSGPLMRATLLSFGARDHVMVWTFSHVLLDGRACARVARDLFDAYDGVRPSTLVSDDFMDYARWVCAQDHAKAKPYWVEKLAELPASRYVPLDPAAEARPGPEKGLMRADLGPSLSQRLAAFAQPHHPPHIVLQVAWSLALSRYSGERDVIVGNVRSCRRPPFERLHTGVGLFINTLPTRSIFQPGSRGMDVLAAAQEEFHEQDSHRFVPISLIKEWSGIPPRAQLFEAAFVYDHVSVHDRIIAGAEFRFAHRRFALRQKSSYPLTLMTSGGPAARLELEYDPQRVGRACAERLLSHVETVVERLLDDPSRCVRDIAAVPNKERRALVEHYNATRMDLPRGDRLHDLFLRAARAAPGAIAVIDGGRMVSYGQLDAWSSRLARRCARGGIAPGALVPVLARRGAEQIAALLAILKCGAAYVPLDPAWPAARIGQIVRSLRAECALLTAGIDRALVPEGVRPLAVDAADDEEGSPCDLGGDDASLAYIIFTSGSTGSPKGVMLDHRSVVNTILDVNQRFGIGPTDRTLGISAYTFDLSVWDVFGLLAAGGTVVTVPDALAREPSEWAALVRRHGVTVWNSVPALAEMLAVHLAGDGTALASLRLFMLSGDWIPLTLPDRLRSVAPQAAQYSLGGATEAAIWSIWYPIERVESWWRSVPYGRPLANQSIHVLDDDLEPSPTLVPGELWIGGEGLAKGYWDDPEKTASRFVVHPRTGERLYRTGDRGRHLGDGDVEFLGRIDGQVKIRGFRIELGEIETAVATYPGVRECVCAVSEIVPGSKSVVAYCRATDATVLDVESVKRHCRTTLPDYMVPATIVPLEAFPLSANGKVDRARLPAPSVAQAIPTRALSMGEHVVAEAVEEVLGTCVTGPDDDFFALGGNSLLAVSLIEALAKHTGRRLPLSTIFAAPTIELLAQQALAPPSAATLRGSRGLLTLSHGSGDPLFLFSEYFDLGRKLSPMRPCYGIDLSADLMLAGSGLSFADLAESCVADLRRVQPQGPYLLGGHCFGAMVALEVAHSLRAQGEEVAFLALIEPPTLPQMEHSGRRLDRYTYHLRQLARLSPLGQARYLWNRVRNIARRVQARLDGIDHSEIYRTFTPRHYRGEVAIILAQDTYYSLDPRRDPRMVWQSWIDSIRVIRVPGDHVTCAREPHASELAKRLEEAITGRPTRGAVPAAAMADFGTPTVHGSALSEILGGRPAEA